MNSVIFCIIEGKRIKSKGNRGRKSGEEGFDLHLEDSVSHRSASMKK